MLIFIKNKEYDGCKPQLLCFRLRRNALPRQNTQVAPPTTKDSRQRKLSDKEFESFIKVFTLQVFDIDTFWDSVSDGNAQKCLDDLPFTESPDAHKNMRLLYNEGVRTTIHIGEHILVVEVMVCKTAHATRAPNTNE